MSQNHHRPVTADIIGQLAAACDAFDELVVLLGDHASRGGPLTVPFVMAFGAAADGRDALITAPALAAAGEGRRRPHGQQGTEAPEAAADMLAERARLLSASLTATAVLAVQVMDRDAATAASGHAAAIHGFLASTGLWSPGPRWGSF
jgi:hypothetical protein